MPQTVLHFTVQGDSPAYKCLPVPGKYAPRLVRNRVKQIKEIEIVNRWYA